MVTGKRAIVHKATWSKLVWARGWALDDAFWRVSCMMHTANNLLARSVGKSRYITWSYISDRWPHLIRMCETMVRVVCHTSRLKCDDFRLKGATHSQVTCERCDLYAVEDIEHILMQCPSFDRDRMRMYDQLCMIDPGFMERCAEEPGEVLAWLLGKPIEGGGDGDDGRIMENIWKTH